MNLRTRPACHRGADFGWPGDHNREETKLPGQCGGVPQQSPTQQGTRELSERRKASHQEDASPEHDCSFVSADA